MEQRDAETSQQCGLAAELHRQADLFKEGDLRRRVLGQLDAEVFKDS